MSVSYDAETLDRLFATLNSYLGHFRHANSFRLVQALFERQTWLGYYFRYRPAKKYRTGELERLYLSPCWFWNLRAQYRYFAARFHRELLFFQVGCFYEFYGQQASRACKLLSVSRIAGKFGFRRRCGIGVKALERCVKLALQQQTPVVVVQQSGYLLRHVAERRVTVKYIPKKILCKKESL